MKNKPVRLMRILFTAFTWLLTSWAFAAEGNTVPAPEKNALMELYKDHSSAGFAVQWPVSAGGVNAVRSKLPRYSYLAFYTSTQLLQNKPLPLVQMGFFRTRAEAEKFVADNAGAFNGLRVVSVSAAEHKRLFAPVSRDQALFWLQPAAMDNLAGAQAVMAEAKNLYMNEQYQQALNYYSALSLVSDRDISVWAQELTGLTYERLGHRDLAKQSYQDLLVSHPEGSWTGRIQQRLRALETAADDGKDALRKSQYAQQSEKYYWRGVLGQTYSYMERGGKYVPDQDVVSALYTYYDLTAGYRLPEHELEVRLNGYDVADMLDHVDNDKTVLRRLYLDYTHVDSGLNLVGGRQKDFDSGQYYYFDGVSVKYPLNSRWRIGANAGVPVQFSDYYDYMDREFFSLQTSFDWDQHLSMAAYVTQQTVYGETDRAAFGGRAQYVADKFSTFANLDYDYEFAEVNLLRWQGSYKFDNRNQLTLNYSLQRSPLLSATNVLLGQPYLNLEEYLQNQFNRDYLLYDALERTSVYESGSIAYQVQVDEDMQIQADIYHAVSSDLPIFGTDDGGLTSDVLSNDAEYRYSSVGVQTIINNFISARDAATLGFRFSDTTLSTSNMVHLSERIRLFGNKLFITPRVHLKYTEDKMDETSQTNLRGSLALNYRPWRNTDLRLEMGNEAVRDLDQNNNIDFSYIYVGYQVRF
jgi:hypothetical protein